MIRVLLHGQDGNGRGRDHGVLAPLRVNHAVDDNHATPLIAAVAGGHIEAVCALLDAGADASCVTRDSNNDSGWDAHRIAAARGREDIAMALQRRGVHTS